MRAFNRPMPWYSGIHSIFELECRIEFPDRTVATRDIVPIRYTLPCTLELAAKASRKFELVAAGRGIAILPSGVASYYSRSDLACLPITDAEPYELCVAVVADQCQQHLRDFVSTAVAALSDGGEEVPGDDVHAGAARYSSL